VIFDGRTPAAKTAVVEKRRVIRLEIEKEITKIQVELAKGDELAEIERAELEIREADLKKKAPKVNREDRDDVKQFLYACGIQFITAGEEADDVLGYLCRTGYLQAVISADMDMLARGIPSLIVPESPDTTVMTIMHTGEILGSLGLTMEQFVVACTLMGSDYTPAGFRGYEARIACDMVRKGVDLDALGLVEALHKLAGEGVTWETLLSDKQREKWLLGIPHKEVEQLQRYCVEKRWPQDWFVALYMGV
jgi:5'-3' exonuclease